MYLAIRADGKAVKTVEGLAEGEKLHPVQEAFIEKDGYQCGFCTPGFLMTTSAFLEKNPAPSLDEIKQALSGNLCRCGNYAKIFEAVDAAARKMRGA
jgi:carbon-monoxide dehydrogenase small subunit